MRRTIGRIKGFLGTLAVTGCVATQPPRLPISVSLPYQSERLANGLSVVTHRDASSPVVSIALAVATGAVDDPEGREGLAHAVEHLVFRAEHASEPSVRLRLDRLGASFNAWTGSEVTVYLATAPKAGLAELVRTFVDIAKDPMDGVRAEALEAERGVLDNERRFRDENGSPGEVVDRMRALVYANGPRGKPIGGTSRSLRAITVDDASAFAKAHYRPNGMTLAVSGDLGDTKSLLAAFADIPTAPAGPAVPPTGAPKPALLDAAGISHVASSVPTPELWLGWALPGAYGPSAPTLEIIADMASGALASGAWDRHSDVTGGTCFLDRGRDASMLVCRAWLSTPDNAAAVKRSLIHVIRKGIADRASERDWRYIYTRTMATEELLQHERLGWRNEELLLGAHFAKNPDFSLERVKGIENAESSAIMALYDRTVTSEAARAVLALPGSAEELAAVPLLPHSFESRGAPVQDLEPFVAGIQPTHAVARVLTNGLHVLVAQREGARFQTALLGFFDGAARVPPAVVDAVRFSYRTFIVDPPAGVLQSLDWDEDAARRVVRGPAGDPRVLLRRLSEGLDHYDFNWKSEGYLDFAKGEKQRENDAREKTPRDFRKQLFFDHPYGAAVVSADVDAVTVPELRNWYDAVHRPENGLLVLVGPEEPGTLVKLAEEELGGFQRSAPRGAPVAARNALVAEQRPGQRLMVGDRPTESQVTIEAGCVLPRGSAASAAAEEVFEELLGTELDDELRQRTGATYGAHVWLERLRGGTVVLHAQSAVSNEQLGPSLKTLYSWFVDGTGLVNESNVKLARFNALEGYVLRTETSVDLANALFAYARRGLAADDFERLPRQIADVDTAAVERLLAACQRTALFSAVGDERRIRAAWPGGH